MQLRTVAALLRSASPSSSSQAAAYIGTALRAPNLNGPHPPPGRPAVPVTVAVAARQDVPIYVTGLGTVQGSFTIAIHSQVDGIMHEVLFTEGQHVGKGDVLARIEPRLFQAALDQAKAKKSQDVATLGAAEKDLDRSMTLVVRSITT